VEPLVILSGPTSVGKTKLSIALAKAINAEIISADSMQVYRHMDIGTAKILPEEMDGVTHHLIDCLNPNEEFHVQRFQQMAKEAIKGIRERGHIPLVVGGTGFYIQALLYDIDFTEEECDNAFRASLEKRAETEGVAALYEELRKVDPKSCDIIHANNVKRVIRALEFYHMHNRPISEHNEEQKEKSSPYNFAYFVLNRNREELYRNIELRVDEMVKAGLEQEIKLLVQFGFDQCTVAMQGLGYKQMLDYVYGKCSLDEAIARIKLETRHFAKRQITWFKREPDVIWFDKSQNSEEEILQNMIDVLKQKGIVSLDEQ